MDIEKSLTQDEMIKELIGLLKANQMGDKASGKRILNKISEVV